MCATVKSCSSQAEQHDLVYVASACSRTKMVRASCKRFTLLQYSTHWIHEVMVQENTQVNTCLVELHYLAT